MLTQVFWADHTGYHAEDLCLVKFQIWYIVGRQRYETWVL